MAYYSQLRMRWCAEDLGLVAALAARMLVSVVPQAAPNMYRFALVLPQGCYIGLLNTVMRGPVPDRWRSSSRNQSSSSQ